MKNFIILIIIFVIAPTLFAQEVKTSCAKSVEFKHLIGTWIAYNGSMIIIDSITKNRGHFLAKSSGYSNNFNLEIIAQNKDILRFQEQFYHANNTDRLITNQYDLQIISFSDSIMTVKPSSKYSKEFFNTDNEMNFTKREYISNPNFKFEKLIFKNRLSPYKDKFIIINNDKSIKVKINRYSGFDRTLNKYILEKSEFYIGTLSNNKYEMLLQKLIKSRVDSLNITSNIISPHSTSKKLKILYNGGERLILENFGVFPKILENIEYFLYEIDKNIELFETKTFDILNFED